MKKLVKDLNNDEVSRDSRGVWYFGEKKYCYSKEEQDAEVEIVFDGNDDGDYFTFDAFLDGGCMQVCGNSYLLQQCFAEPRKVLIGYEGKRDGKDGCYWNILEYNGKEPKDFSDNWSEDNLMDTFSVIGTVITWLQKEKFDYEENMKHKIIDAFVYYLIILLFISVIVASYVTFEKIGVNSISNILIQASLFAFVSWKFEKNKS